MSDAGQSKLDQSLIKVQSVQCCSLYQLKPNQLCVAVNQPLTSQPMIS